MDAADPKIDSVRIVREPTLYLVGVQKVEQAAIDQFLTDHGASWETDTDVGAERLTEAAGRICYMSFGKGRKSHAEYMHNIVSSGHGSVLEHAVWNVVVTGVSRSFTHELIRHRAGFAYSQLSQRYVDESSAEFVEPDCIAEDEELHAVWLKTVAAAQAGYRELVEKLTVKFSQHPDKTLRRKLARQAARSVLPNACETKIFVSANARGLRHFIELRGSEHADVEIRTVALKMLRLMRQHAPVLFSDYEIRRLDDGAEVVYT
ncbi:MAG: FAD-dependent thymidylate synthase, partial [Planctomycetia bacterium]